MKKITTLSILIFIATGLFAQTFETELEYPSLVPYYVLENKEKNYLFAHLEENGSELMLKFSTLDKFGKIQKSVVIEQSDSIYFNIKKIIPTDSEYICIGNVYNRKYTNLSKLRVWILNKDFSIRKQLEYALTNGESLTNMDACIYKKGYCIAWVVTDKFGVDFSYIRFIDEKNNVVFKQFDYISALLPSKESTYALSRAYIYQLNDSLNIMSKSKVILPFNGAQGQFNQFEDSTYLIASKYIKNQPNMQTMGLFKWQYPFKNLNESFYFKTKDTLELGALNNMLDFKDKNNIYLGLTSNVTFTNDKPSWFKLSNFDRKINLRWTKYFGGDAIYNLYGIKATDDGGCILYGTKYYFNSSKKYTTYLLKLNAQGQLVSSDGVIQENSEVKIFPNPTHNIINISLAQQNELYNLQCVDSQGRIVYTCEVQGYCSFDVSQWQSGVYAFTIRDKKGNLMKTERVVVR